MRLELVHEIAVAVRQAIENIPPRDLPITFSSFPCGSCGDTALVLGTYLAEDCGIEGFEYVCGDRGSRQNDTWLSHAWLDYQGLIVDITADQFSDAPGSIIVEYSSPWHANFRNLERSKSNVHHCSGSLETVVTVYYIIRGMIGSPWRDR